MMPLLSRLLASTFTMKASAVDVVEGSQFPKASKPGLALSVQDGFHKPDLTPTQHRKVLGWCSCNMLTFIFG